MSPTNQKKGPGNIPAKTAILVSSAVMIAAAYALAKNPATVKNIRKRGNRSNLIFGVEAQGQSTACQSKSPARKSIGRVFTLDGELQIVYRIFTINSNLERLK